MAVPEKLREKGALPINSKGRGRGLSVRQERFVQEYIKDGSCTQAALRAGYSKWAANSASVKLLRHPKIMARLGLIEERATAKIVNDRARILQELHHMAFNDPIAFCNPDGTLKPIHEVPEEARRALSALKMGKSMKTGETYVREVKFEKLGALESLAKINGMMQENQAQVAMGLNIHIHSGEKPDEMPAIETYSETTDIEEG